MASPTPSSSTGNNLSPPDTSHAPPATTGYPNPQPGEKRKIIRGQRACLSCRSIKMKCVNAEFPPCVRCTRSGEECVFTESRRGKQPKKRKIDPETGLPIPRAPASTSSSSSSARATTAAAASVLSDLRHHPHVAANAPGIGGSSERREGERREVFIAPASTSGSLPSTSSTLATASPFSHPTFSSSASSSSTPAGPAYSATPAVGTYSPHSQTADLASLRSSTYSPPTVPIYPQSSSYSPHELPPVPNILGRDPRGSISSASNPSPPFPSAATPGSFGVPTPPFAIATPSGTGISPSGSFGREGSVGSGSRSVRSETLALRPLSAEHPLGVLAEASRVEQLREAEQGVPSPMPPTVTTSNGVETLNVNGKRGRDDEDGKADVGIASRKYFLPESSGGSARARGKSRPEAESLLTKEDVEELFELFYKHLHVHSPTVDKDVCTPEYLAVQSHTLFNAICCLAARYHPTRGLELSSTLHELAKKELAIFPNEKTLECVQAQILYCGYALVPAETFETDLTWLRVGMALRLAIDLNLHRAGQGGVGEQSIPPWRLKSMRRTWLICTVMDRTTSAQLGKPTLLWSQNTHGGFTESPSDSPDERRVYAQVELSEIVARSLDELRREGPRAEGELPEISIRFERKLEDWREKWIERVKWGLTDDHHRVRQARIRLSFHNAQLLFASIALQRALNEDADYAPFALAKYQTAALAILRTFRDDMAATGLGRYCTDFHYGSVLYAAVSLLKSVQTQFRHCLVDKITAGKLINSTADALEDAACRWDHLPNLQSRFLRRVLNARLPEYVPPPRAQPKEKEIPAFLLAGTSKASALTADGKQPNFDAIGFAFNSHHTRPGAVDEQFEPSIFNFDFNSAPTEMENQFFESTRIDPMDFPDFWVGGPSLGGLFSARSSRAPSRAASPTMY